MKKPMTVRLDENVLEKLSTLASQAHTTRQNLVEKILIDAVKIIPDSCTDKTVSYVPSYILESIKLKSSQFSVGTEVSLKQLVGENEWALLTDATRRVFGKQFRDMVHDGDFPYLHVGRKKSNNEQQYIIQSQVGNE